MKEKAVLVVLLIIFISILVGIYISQQTPTRSIECEESEKYEYETKVVIFYSSLDKDTLVIRDENQIEVNYGMRSSNVYIHSSEGVKTYNAPIKVLYENKIVRKQ